MRITRGHKLMTKKLKDIFNKTGSQESLGEDAKVILKLFTPDSNWTWYATEFEEETGNFFGLVDGFESELGYFNLAELEEVTGPMGLPVERDLYFEPKSKTINNIKETIGHE